MNKSPIVVVVDQIADIRDVIANLHQLSKDSTDKWKWVALAITLILPWIGLVAGSAAVMAASSASAGGAWSVGFFRTGAG